MKIPLMNYVALCLSLVMFIIGITPRVDAGIAPSELISVSNMDREADIERIQKVIETKMIRERLKKLGFTQEEITVKLTQLSDQQLHQLALKIDDINVGGDYDRGLALSTVGMWMGFIIAILGIIALFVELFEKSSSQDEVSDYRIKPIEN